VPEWRQIDAGVGNLGEFFVFLPNVLLIAFNGASVSGSRGGWGVEGVALGSYVVTAGEEG
jgi:hypothetical protein